MAKKAHYMEKKIYTQAANQNLLLLANGCIVVVIIIIVITYYSFVLQIEMPKYCLNTIIKSVENQITVKV